MNAQSTSADTEADLPLEIAYLLLIDVVGYSKLLVNEQVELLEELNHIVRSSECFRAAEASGKLIRVPTGDGMALLFFHSPEEPVRCALEISRALKGHSRMQVRMGVHSGPVNPVKDVNDQTNIAGSGINVGQRVLRLRRCRAHPCVGPRRRGFVSIPALAAVSTQSGRVRSKARTTPELV